MVALSTSGTIPKLDLVKFASDIMSEVEGVRSYTPSFDDEAKLANQRPTESRVNAFFRLIGLPMFVSITPPNSKGKTGGNETAEKMMTPGYSKGGLPPGVIVDSNGTQLRGPDGKDASVQKLLGARETKLREREQSIGTPDTNLRMESAFYYPMDLVLNKSAFDLNGSEVFKRVSPFAVSYMPVLPGQNELSKPFLANPESGRPPPPTTPIRRPFIETVVRIRTVVLDGGNQGQTDYLAATRARVEQLSQQAADLLPASMEAFIIDQMLGAIDQFADRWVMLQTRKERLSKDVTIVLRPKTISAQRSTFGKRGNLMSELDISDTSETGQRLTALNRGIAVSEAMIGLLPTEDNTSLTGTTVKNIMPNALTNTFVSILRQPLEQQRRKLDELNATVTALSQQADRLRLEQEMMTGEFTGLSLPDVVFTILGLFLISREDLVAMLDDDTLDQMRLDPVLKTVADSGGDPAEAVAHLEDKVLDLYDALGTAIEFRMQRSKRTSKGSTPLVSAPPPQDAVAAADLAAKLKENEESSSETGGETDTPEGV